MAKKPKNKGKITLAYHIALCYNDLAIELSD